MVRLSEEQGLVRETARQYAQDKLAGEAALWEQKQTLSRAFFEELGSLGFGAIYCDPDVGGSGMGRLDAVLTFEALSHGCVSHATMLSIHNMATWMIDTFGDQALRERLVPDLASCKKVASYCLTEPGAGSDAASLRTKAVKDGDHYVLNGSKAFISGGGWSDLYVVMARTGGEGPKGITAFVVEKDSPGLSFGKKEEKMGWSAQPTAAVIMEDCRVPATNILGKEGQGFSIAMAGLDGGRLNIAAASLGGAQEAFERSIRYAQERKQFGQAVSDFQATQFKLADMETSLQAARVFLYSAAQKLDDKAPDATKFCAMAKRFVTDTGFDVANQALQIHGGYGYLRDYEIERIVRDLRVHQILEGTNEVMRVIISRALLKDYQL